jgi:hypothetical protein
MNMTIEQQLFDSNGWDGDYEDIIYYNPVLKVQIGKYPPGSKFDDAIINFHDGTLQLTNQRGLNLVVMGEYSLHLIVGETLSESDAT